jgi:hypothetical protein
MFALTQKHENSLRMPTVPGRLALTLGEELWRVLTSQFAPSTLFEMQQRAQDFFLGQPRQ